MKKILFSIVLFLTIAAYLNAQTSNFRAQGNYYSAKSNYQNGNYVEALSYINKSKIALNGTNDQLQYLHVMSAYKMNKFQEAKVEMERFFDLHDNKIKSVKFDKSVDELSNDETKEMTMIMDKVFESVDKIKNSPCAACKGSGRIEESKQVYCNKCGDETKSERVFLGSTGRRFTSKIYEMKGCTATQCADCGGKGFEVCDRCDGGRKNCPGCVQKGNYMGYSFYCKKCSKGTVFKRCDICKGEKYYTIYTGDKKTCNKCNGKGFED